MTDLQPFRFEDFCPDNRPPVLDLEINRRTPEETRDMLLSDINLKLQMLLDDQMKNSIKAIKMFLSELAPSLAQEYGEKIISDYLRRRFPSLSEKQNLKIYVNADNVDAIEELMKNSKYGAGRVIVCEDNALSKGDCRIAWSDGEELFSTAEILDKIRDRLKGVISDD